MRVYRNSVFISIIGVVLLLIICIMPKKLTLRTAILDIDRYSDFTNMIFKENDKELSINNKKDIEFILNTFKEIKIKKVNYHIEDQSEIELRFFSIDKPESLRFSIYNKKYIEIMSSIDGDYNNHIYEILQINNLNKIIEEIKGR